MAYRSVSYVGVVKKVLIIFSMFSLYGNLEALVEDLEETFYACFIFA